MDVSSLWKRILESLSVLWQKSIIYRISYLALTLLVIIVIILFGLWRAPADFPLNTIYTLKKGAGLSATTEQLQESKIIRSPFWFKVFSVIFGGTRGIQAGDYALIDKQNTVSLAYRMSFGDFGLRPIKITFPEGLNVFEMSKIISKKFVKINSESFVDLAINDEGYLFPDTYFFLPNVTSEDIVKIMKENFQKKIVEINSQITVFGKSFSDVIKLASILEEEARTTESKQIVAGILWKRLDIGMPLQVDASFKYINGKTTKDLTLDDLKIDSPYNSYLYKGLPPTPICNPGLDSIRATITPIKTDYLFFLNDKDGKMHYAKTYAEHLQNKELYLK